MTAVKNAFPKIDSMYAHLSRKLDSERYYHSLGTMQISVAMAMSLGINPGKAALAGLLHDCERCESKDRLLEKIDKFNIDVPSEELQYKSLLHTFVGAYTARLDFKVEDPDVLQAIVRHATGDANMSQLDKLVFVADLIEPTRRLPSEEIKIIRSIAFRDLEEAFRLTINEKKDHLGPEFEKHPRTRRMLEQYDNRGGKRRKKGTTKGKRNHR